MPQSVTVAISLGTQDLELKAGGIGNECPPESNTNNKAQTIPRQDQEQKEGSTSSHTKLKLKTLHLELEKPSSSVIGIKHHPIPQIKSNIHHHTMVKAAHPPAKRTKQIAKSKTKYKSKTSRARKLPTKINKTKAANKSTSAMAKHLPSSLPLKNSQPSTSTHELKQQQQGGGGGPETHLRRDTDPIVILPNTITNDYEMEKVARTVADMAADVIRYCASVFGPKLQRVIIDNESEAGSPHKKTSSSHLFGAAEATRHLPIIGSHKQGFTKGYSVNIDHEGNIHSMTSSNPGNHSISRTLSQEASPNSEMFDVQTVVIAVRRFVIEVYCPFLHSAKRNMGNDSPSADRIQLSTLLAIREMFLMNADKLFEFSHLKHSSINSIKRERTHLSHTVANAIIQNTAKRLHDRQPEGRFYADFTQATKNYDVKSEDFRFSLSRADVRSLYVHQGGSEIGQEESFLVKVSYNHARARHPLLVPHTKRVTFKDDDAHMGIARNESSVNCPVPTVCAAFHIEVAAASGETKDDSKILESLKKVLSHKRKALRV